MKKLVWRIWIETAILMLITFAIDLGLLTYHTPLWVVFLITAAIFVGGDTYYQHKAPGGHDDE